MWLKQKIDASFWKKLAPALAVAILFPISLLWLKTLSLFILVLACYLLFVIVTDPKTGLFALIIVRPLLDSFTNYSVISSKNFSLNLSSVLALATLIFAASVILKHGKKIKTIPLKIPIVLFLLATFISSVFFSFAPEISFPECFRLLSIFSLYSLGFLLINTSKDLLAFLKVIIFSAFIPGLVAAYQFFADKGITIPTEEIYNRIFGTFAHPNLFAYYLFAALTLAIFMMLSGKKTGLADRKIFAGLFIFFTLLLILTYTRGAWAALLLVILLIGLIEYRKFFIGAAAVIIFLYLAVYPIQIRVNNLLTLTPDPDSSVQWRLVLWRDSVNYVKEAPVIGHGTGTAKELILERRGPKFGSTDPHNDYLKLALENGLLGLFIYAFLILSLLINIFIQYLRARDQVIKTLLLFIFGMTVSLYIMSFADNVLRNTVLQWTYWSLLGAVFSVCAISNKIKTDHK